MRTRVVYISAAAAVLALTAPLTARLNAQTASSTAAPMGITIAPYAGYMHFGDILKGPIGSTLSHARGPVYGAQLGMVIAPNVSLIGNVARASGDLTVGLPLLGGISVGSSTAWMYDGALQFDLPLSSRSLTPFVQVGAGAIHNDILAGPLTTSATNVAANVGLGADLAVIPNMGLRFLATDYIGKFDFPGASTLGLSGGVAHNLLVGAGITLRF